MPGHCAERQGHKHEQEVVPVLKGLTSRRKSWMQAMIRCCKKGCDGGINPVISEAVLKLGFEEWSFMELVRVLVREEWGYFRLCREHPAYMGYKGSHWSLLGAILHL